MKKPETWLCMKKQIFLNNVRGEGGETKKKNRKKRKERGNVLCKHQNKLQLNLRYIRPAL